ncbi:hypothetical protein GNF10_32265, partial [Nostoc sp. UCD121]|uniref:hypothetical protein n=1 Tax=Nostoc sp. UCD121 TaxID=2681305 RepID=UPI001627F2EC
MNDDNNYELVEAVNRLTNQVKELTNVTERLKNQGENINRKIFGIGVIFLSTVLEKNYFPNDKIGIIIVGIVQMIGIYIVFK